MYIRAVTASDANALSAFFGAIPEGDRMFFKEDVLDPDVVGGWTTGDQRGWRLLGLGDDGVVGYVAALPGLGWSSQVGELRLVVAPGHRRRGVGRDLARRGLMVLAHHVMERWADLATIGIAADA